jgi:methylmalonyl-CoA epimerase
MAETHAAGTEPLSAPAWGPCTFHHVGCAVRSIEQALEFYSGLLGFRRLTEPIAVPAQKVRVCFVELRPGVLLELVEGVEAGSPVALHVERTGGGPYHLCFQVPELDAAIAALRRQGCHRLNRFEAPAFVAQPPPAVAGERNTAEAWGQSATSGLRRFAFLLSPDRQLFELCEPDRSAP